MSVLLLLIARPPFFHLKLRMCNLVRGRVPALLVSSLGEIYLTGYLGLKLDLFLTKYCGSYHILLYSIQIVLDLHLADFGQILFCFFGW